MKQALNVFRFEFLRYFNTPVAFVYLMAFLLLNGSCAFYLGYFLERGMADLLPMFAYIPWLYLFFVPAISMRLWADEYKSNTFYQTISLPVSISSLSVGKFLAAWAFCLLGLFLTFEFWITLNVIAKPDNSVVISSYIAASLLSGALISIALFASSITKNQVVALIVGICLILFFFLSGLDFVLGFYKMILPLKIVDILASFSILTHYSSALAGLIELKSVLYFASIVVFFNFLTIVVIKAKISPQRSYRFVYLFAFVLFIGFNLLGFKSVYYKDFSQDKRHSLSFSTQDVLENLKEPVTAKLYYSEILSEKNANFREVFAFVKTLLKQYERMSGGKFKFEVVNPKTLSKEEDIAIANGLEGLPIFDSNQNAFFGLVITDALDNKEVIKLFEPNNQSFLEPMITQKIYLLNHKKPVIGVISGVDMFESIVGGVATQNWRIVEEISSFYEIKRIDNQSPEIGNVSALIIVDPKKLSDELIKNILAYKDNGGKFLIMLDPSPEAFRLFAPQTKPIEASDFSRLEKDFGFRFLHQVFAADLDSSLSVDATIDYSQNPIITQDVAQILLTEELINQDASPTHGLKQILLSSASILAPVDDKDFSFTPLLVTSKNSSLMSSEYLYKNINPATILANFKKDEFKKILAAKIVNKNTNSPFKAIVIADSDFMYDNYLSASDNLYLVLNSLDELTGNHRLLSLRAKSGKIYRLEMLEDLRKKAQLDYAVNEAKLLEKIATVKTKINEVINKKTYEGRDDFVADELALIAKLRKNLDEAKNELGKLKENSYKELEALGNKIKLINIYLLPLIILLGLLLKYAKNDKISKTTTIVFDKKTIVLMLVSFLMLALGIVFNMEAKKIEVNELVFKDVDVAKIESIAITHDGDVVDLYKEEGKWQIKGHEGFVVYTERVKNLLTAIVSASYYEEKSNKIENLSYFGLGDKGKTFVELGFADGKRTSFYIGKYDIDLGRGSRGAYYRSDKNYDVWLIEADLIDISPNWREFCYSLLWNLRFGKAYDIEADVIKDMINTPLLGAYKDVKNAKKTFELQINTNTKIVEISFYEADDKYYANYNFDKTFYEISKDDYLKLNKISKSS